MDGVIHRVSEPLGSITEKTLAVSCTITVNTVTEVGVKRVSPILDEKIVEHRETESNDH